MNRLALLKLVILMLYAGPLIAGLAGQGWGVLPAFAATFVLWQIVMRPADWPREAAGWTAPRVVTALAHVALMVVLVAVMFGIGRGIGGVTGHLPQMPPYLPLALSFLAVPLARLVHDPAKAQEMDAFLTDALRQIDAIGEEDEEDDQIAAAIDPLLLLPDEAPDATARAGVAAILSLRNMSRRLRALNVALAEAPGASLAARRGLILWSTERPVAEAYSGLALAADGFAAAGSDEALLRLFAEHALPLIVDEPELWGDFPSTGLVRDMAARVADAETARLLGALAQAQDQAEAIMAARRTRDDADPS